MVARRLTVSLSLMLPLLAFGPSVLLAEEAPRDVRQGLTVEQMQELFPKVTSRGYVPTYLKGHVVDCVVYLDAIFESIQVDGCESRVDLSDEGFKELHQDLTGRGYRLVSHSAYRVDGEARHTAIWHKARRNPPPALFSGHWSGTWTNSAGESGIETLDLEERADGTIIGIWWDDIPIRGKRRGPHDIEFQGSTHRRHYAAVGRLNSGQLVIRYVATRLDDGGSYTGESRLTRVEPE